MRLLWSLLGVFVFTVVTASGSAAFLWPDVQAPVVGLLALGLMPLVLSSLVGTWIAFTRTYPLWYSAMVVVVGTAWEWLLSPSLGMQGFCIPVLLCFVIVLVPLLIMRFAGFRLVHTIGAEHVSVPTAQRLQLGVCFRRHFSLRSLLSAISAVAVVYAASHLIIQHVPRHAVEELLSWELLLFVGYFSLTLPQIVYLTLAVAPVQVKAACVVVLFTYGVASTILLLNCFAEWQIIVVVGLIPTVCLCIGFGWLYLAGIRLVLEGRTGE